MIKRCLCSVLLTVLAASALAAEVEAVLDTAERFARQQTQGMTGKVEIKAGPLDVNRLPSCSALEAFAPAGTRLAGKTHVGVRCLGPAIWSVLVPVRITVMGSYLTTARPLIAGQVIAEGDLVQMSGDMSILPTGVIADLRSAVGKTLRNSLAAGQPLRADQLQAPLVVRQGQTVNVVSAGQGFAVSSEGKALNNAAEGQLVRVQMSSGQTLSGIAKSDGSVEMSF